MNFWDQHKTITCYYALLTKSVCDKFNLTQMEYAILMFLHNNPQYNTAADIVRTQVYKITCINYVKIAGR